MSQGIVHSEDSTDGHFRCPNKNCHAVLRSKMSLTLHAKYFHAEKRANNLTTDDVSDPSNGSNTSEGPLIQATAFFCEEEQCISKCGKRKQFKSYANLKQHYMLIHAKKIYSCRKCGKMFSEVSRKNRHESDCDLKLICSCGIMYHGKRGFRSHIRLTRHPCPEENKKYLKENKLKIPRKIVKKKEKKLPPKTLLTPRLIAPRPCPNFPRTVTLVSPNPKLPLPKLPIKSKSQLVDGKSCGRFLIDVICPSQANALPECNSCTSSKLCTSEFSAPTIVLFASEKVDSLSAAMLSSGISCTNEEQAQSSDLPTVSSSEIQSKTSQTDWSMKNQSGQDFSCQTDEFLAWLDSESEKCTSQSGNEHSTSNTCTQTLQADLDELVGQVRSVTQHETQTNDDWLSELLHESDYLSSEVSNAEAQTSFQSCQTSSYNENSNNNHLDLYYSNPVSDSGCDTQTQTAFLESVTTQTNCQSELTNSTSSFTFDIETQTDLADINIDSVVNTIHTQTVCDDLTEFLEMETQTDFIPRSGSDLSVGQTQTLMNSTFFA